MSVIQVQLPDHVKDVIDRQVSDGRVASESDFLVQAVLRFAENLSAEGDIVGEAKAGVAGARSRD